MSRNAGSIEDENFAASPRSIAPRIHLSPLESAERSTRLELIRNVAVFQVKLAADGLRDLVLSPISIVAGLIGIFMGGPNASAPFQNILKIGQRTDRWIDLFGTFKAEGKAQRHEPSLDNIADKIEDIIRKDYANGGVSATTRTHIDEILKGFARQNHQRQNNPHQSNARQSNSRQSGTGKSA